MYCHACCWYISDTDNINIISPLDTGWELRTTQTGSVHDNISSNSFRVFNLENTDHDIFGPKQLVRQCIGDWKLLIPKAKLHPIHCHNIRVWCMCPFTFAPALQITVFKSSPHPSQWVELDELLCFQAVYQPLKYETIMNSDPPRPVHGYLANIFYRCNLTTPNQIPSVQQPNNKIVQSNAQRPVLTHSYPEYTTVCFRAPVWSCMVMHIHECEVSTWQETEKGGQRWCTHTHFIWCNLQLQNVLICEPESYWALPTVHTPNNKRRNKTLHHLIKLLSALYLLDSQF
jgi:hypothetical protein